MGKQNVFHYNITEGCSKVMNGDGVNNYVDFGDVTFLDGLDAFSVSAWVYFDQVSTQSPVIAKWNGGGGNTGFLVDVSGSNFRVFGPGNTSVIGTYAASAETLYQLTYVKNATTVKLYIDGVERISGANSNSVPNTTEPLLIYSKTDGGTPNSFMDGFVKDVEIWTSELSADNATYLATRGASGTDPGDGVFRVKGYGNTDADWEDQIGSNDGTVTGSPGVRYIPALLDESADALGNTITNPAVAVHNGAESISEDTCLPIWSRAKIDVPSFGEFWGSLRTETQVVNRNDLDIEMKDLSKSSYKALAYKGGIGYWKNIKSISRHKFTGDIIELNQKHGVVHATPNHSVYDVDFNLVSAESNPELLGCRMISYKSRKEADKDWNIFCSAFVSDGWTTRRNTHGGTKEGQYEIGVVKSNREWIELLASILEAKGYEPVITSAKRKGLTSTGDEYKTLYTVSVVDEELYHQMREDCGVGAHGKKIPSWVFTEPKELQELFIEHLLNGDGSTYKHKNYNSYRFTTVSKKLATGLSLLLTMVGEDFTQTHNVERKSYDLNWGGIRSHGQLTKNLVKVPYDGYVYDIEVEDFHNFVCGVGNVVVHNTQIDFTGGVSDAPWVSKVYRGHATFNGTSSYIQLPFAGNASSSYQIEFTMSTTNSSGTTNLFDFRDSSTDGLLISISAAGGLTVAHNSTSVQLTGMNDGVERSFVVSWDGATLSLTDGTTTDTDTVASALSVTADGRIGARSFTSLTQYFPGNIRDVSITLDGSLTYASSLSSNSLDTTANNNNPIDTDITYPTYTVPTAYSFGDAFSPSGQTNHYKKEISSVREDDFTMFSPGLDTTGDTTMTDEGYTN